MVTETLDLHHIEELVAPEADVVPDILPIAPISTPGQINRPVGEGKANATMVMLCRNDEIENVLSSMASVEKRFNKRFGYPWVFLNEVEFTDEFKRWV